MSGLFGSRAFGRLRLRLSYRTILVGVLLVTASLVPDVLAKPGQHSWTALSEACSVLIYSGGRAGMGARVMDETTIITCAHIIGNTLDVQVEGIGIKPQRARVIVKNDIEDIAILSIKGPGIPFKIDWSPSGQPIKTPLLQAVKRHFEGPATFNQTQVLGTTSTGNVIVAGMPKIGCTGGAVFLANGQLVGIVKGQTATDECLALEIIPILKIVNFLP